MVLVATNSCDHNISNNTNHSWLWATVILIDTWRFDCGWGLFVASPFALMLFLSPAALLLFEAHFLPFLWSRPSPRRHHHRQRSHWYVSAEVRRLQRQRLESKEPQTAACGAPGNLRLKQPTDPLVLIFLFFSFSSSRWWESSSWSVNDKGGSRH